jgi:ABC-type antimicrobial peptide transport system permease subunit
LVGALAITQLIQSMLFSVASTDPTVFALALSVSLAVSVFALCWLARRAAGVDPMVVLRCE